MGVVVLALDEKLQRHVAIKIVRAELLDSEDLRARFLQEARAMARVSHPNVLQIHAFGEIAGAPYFVMEYAPGTTVEEWLAASAGPPDLDVALRILDDTCEGVNAIHAAQTVHRDLKPSNLLLDERLRVRVADLGLANVLRDERRPPLGTAEESGTTSRVSGAGGKHIVGTPRYMAPEIALQHDVPPELMQRADVYSLGCIAYELLTGTPPFDAPSSIAIMLKHTTEPVDRPSARRPELPPGFDAVLAHALAKDPRERTPSADALRRELAAARDRTSEPVRILVADDDADFREALEVMLSQEFPYAMVESLGDGAAALAAYERRQHSVAIIDLRMPGLDGTELTARMRARGDSAATPIIVLTASGGPPEWKRLAALGADGFLVKPVDLRDVATLVRRAIADRAGLRPSTAVSAHVEPAAGLKTVA
jgi:serine/threonine-protein kinase